MHLPGAAERGPLSLLEETGGAASRRRVVRGIESVELRPRPSCRSPPASPLAPAVNRAPSSHRSADRVRQAPPLPLLRLLREVVPLRLRRGPEPRPRGGLGMGLLFEPRGAAPLGPLAGGGPLFLSLSRIIRAPLRSRRPAP